MKRGSHLLRTEVTADLFSDATRRMDNHKLGISTISMGWHLSHTLEAKLTAASKHGFAGVEIFWMDLAAYAERHTISPIEAAPLVKDLCREVRLEVVCLSSFDNFEGSHRPLSDRLTLAKEWIEIAHGLGTDMIQIPSNDDRSCNGEEDTIVSELRQLADVGSAASPPIRFAYEALGWSTHVADWEESLRIVELVNRGNFGLCLDTYHILARLWADFSSDSGVRPGGKAALHASIKRLLNCPKERIFYVQLSDAERCHPPLLPGHPAYSLDKFPSHSWCSWGRLFPGEVSEGAYLPMAEICRAMLMHSGWKGWVSMEIFHRKMKDETADPVHWARRGRASWDGLCSSLK